MDDASLLGFAGTALAGFFAIMNPVANTPIFISLTEGDDAATKRSIARRSLILAFAIITVLSIAGNVLFGLFGITLAALRITGGILVFLIGYHMVQGGGHGSHTPANTDIQSAKDAELAVAVSPLAVPILAGPGTIATAMNFAAGGIAHIVVSIVCFAVVCLASYACFLASDRIVRFFGQNGLNVMTRLMGLIVATIGVGMLMAGLGEDVLKLLTKHAT